MGWFRKHLKWIDRPKNKKARSRVAFFKAYPWHSYLLEPVASKLFSKVDLCAAEYGRDLISFAHDVIVVADAGVIPFLKKHIPQATYIHICHGLISKKQPFYSYSHADYICVSSDYIAYHLQARGCSPLKQFWPIGLPMMNLVSLNASTPRTSPLTLLYAPTWNPGLSSAEIFSKRLIECLRGPHETWSILIKPHPHSFKESPEWIKLWRELSQTHPHVALIDEEQDLACYIPKADMMISDTSSAPFLFLSVNRPILLLQNPQALNDPQTYDPQGIEWQWKEMTYEVFQPEEVYPTIEHILSQGDPKYALRKEY